MAPRPPNYQQQRGDRDRAKAQKKQERLRQREEDAARRRAERAPEPGDSPAATPETNVENR